MTAQVTSNHSPNSNGRHPIVLAIVIFIVVAAFGMGILVGRSAKYNDDLVTSLSDTKDTFDLLYINQLIQQISSTYLGDVPTKEQITYGIAKGIVDSLGDEYSAFLNPDETKDYLASADSSYEGVGLQLGYNGQYTNIVTVMRGQPGEAAGLLEGDVILSVDGKDQNGQRPELVATLIRGKAGSSVELSIYRESSSEVLTFDIVRAQINLENITYSDLGDGIFSIEIAKFTEGSQGILNGVQVFNQNWDRIVNEISGKDPKGIVIDLRSNPGGYVESVRYVLEEFLSDSDIIMREQEKNKDENLYIDHRKGKFEDIPITVLVNSGSASASEIFAGAVQDNNRGKIIGTETVGKGVEQQLFTLDNGGMLILVFRKWLTPNGNQLDSEHKIVPDISIEFDRELWESQMKDNQLIRGVEELKSN